MPYAGPAVAEPDTGAFVVRPASARDPAIAMPGQPPVLTGPPVPVSATLAANEAIEARRRRGEPVLPLAFGQVGLPVLPVLAEVLAEAASCNGYGPVAGSVELREAAAGYWRRRRIPATAESVVCGPGSKPLLYALLQAIGGDVALPRPSWVSYAAQAKLIGIRPHYVDVPPGEGGICDPGRLARLARAAAAVGRPVRMVIVTLPDNPTGRLASPATVRALCEVAAEHGMVIISDEIYRDLVHDPAIPLLSPAEVSPARTVVTTGLSKSLALGGWRIGVARLPAGRLGETLRERLLGIASEIWSAPAAPMQHAAAFAFSEPPIIGVRIAASASLHAKVALAVYRLCAAAGVRVDPPQGGIYVYPDFGPWRATLRKRDGVRGANGLARLLARRYGAGTLPGSAFGEPDESLRLRLATGGLYGETAAQREQALCSPDPERLAWIAAALARFTHILADLAP
jgi:aspartate aminotransferase